MEAQGRRAGKDTGERPGACGGLSAALQPLRRLANAAAQSKRGGCSRRAPAGPTGGTVWVSGGAGVLRAKPGAPLRPPE